MGILTGIDEAKQQISTAEKAFVGRLTSAKITISTRSLPPTNYYQLVFEENMKPMKGSPPTTNEFGYHQTGKGGRVFTLDGQEEKASDPKEPQSGGFYVVICDPNENKVQTLIEIDENDTSAF